MMPTSLSAIKDRIDSLRGVNPVEADLSPYDEILRSIGEHGRRFSKLNDASLKARAASILAEIRLGSSIDEYCAEFFALGREVATRTVAMRPFNVQIVAGLSLHRSKLVEMATGEGKTLAAVLPAAMNALVGRGVHVLTFNDYLARRDAEWMRPIYEFLGLSVGVVQEGMGVSDRRAAYACDVTYATAKEAGFDFLRTHLCRDIGDVVIRPYHFAIVDEADSILIDEARTPLVIAGELEMSDISPYRIAEIVTALEPCIDWEMDENERNVHLTDRGLSTVESALGGANLHEEEHYTLLTEVNQSLHAHALLHRDVDYIVRDGVIELVDEFTGRVVKDRRWPDGLQAALEAKERLEIRPGGRVLGSITMQHFMRHYPKLSGMTATAQSAAKELVDFYGLKVVPIPPNRPSVRTDLPDEIYSHREAKDEAILQEIRSAQSIRRPVLVGTRSVEESERIQGLLESRGFPSMVLNAKNDESEAELIAEAGKPGAITISTNMAGRGTDIKLGGADERERDIVVRAGGLHVIGTNRHESRRVDDQLRGRAGRQGDPGSSKFIVALDDALMVRFGIDELIPGKIRHNPQMQPLAHPVIRREVDRLQRIVDGQNRDIRKTLFKYSSFVEEQRKRIQNWRMELLSGLERTEVLRVRSTERYAELESSFGVDTAAQVEVQITLHHIDEAWADHLARIARVRESIHLVGLGGLKPLNEFRKQVGEAFKVLFDEIEDRVVETFESIEFSECGIDLDASVLKGPSSTWTYLVNDQAVGELQELLFGAGSYATGAGAALTAGPLILLWGIRERLRRRS